MKSSSQTTVALLLAVVLTVPTMAARSLNSAFPGMDKDKDFPKFFADKMDDMKHAVDHLKSKHHKEKPMQFPAPNYLITQQPQYVVAAMPQMMPQVVQAPVVAAAPTVQEVPPPPPTVEEKEITIYTPRLKFKPVLVPLPLPVPPHLAMKGAKKMAGKFFKAVAHAVLENAGTEYEVEEEDDTYDTSAPAPAPAAMQPAPVPSAPAETVFVPTPVPTPTPVPVPTPVPTPVPAPSAPLAVSTSKALNQAVGIWQASCILLVFSLLSSRSQPKQSAHTLLLLSVHTPR
ncbi:hypothetical protein COO60DRAFT_1035390 [Scenedesmus sp. NREL 46B-D3]|nr:hypothetical protein COO60DRAFT_1035390 [Scenedesmus sp. NREL 46B-D3]